MAELRRVIPDAAAELQRLDGAFERATELALGEHELAVRALNKRAAEEDRLEDAQHAGAVAEIDGQLAAAMRNAEAKRDRDLSALREIAQGDSQAVAKRREEAIWFADTGLESDLARYKQTEIAERGEVQAAKGVLEATLRRAGVLRGFGEVADAGAVVAFAGSPAEALGAAVAVNDRLRAEGDRVSRGLAVRLTSQGAVAGLFVLCAVAGAGIGWLAGQRAGAAFAGVGAGCLFALIVLVAFWTLAARAGRALRGWAEPEVASGRGALMAAMKNAEALAESRRQHAASKHAKAISAAKADADTLLKELERRLADQKTTIAGEHGIAAKAAIDAAESARRAEAARRAGVQRTFHGQRGVERGAADARRDQAIERATRERDAGVGAVQGRWAEAMRFTSASFGNASRATHFGAGEFAPGATSIGLGYVVLDVRGLASVLKGDGRVPVSLAPEVELPIGLELPRHGHLLLLAGAGQRKAGGELLSAAALRLLECLPPGKLRLTFIDPVGLGQSFAAFMRLADLGPQGAQIVGERIWTEQRQIEEKLAEITEHMETVIQKYLQDRYATIDEYNKVAGEVAEPYRVIVFADLPTNLSEVAARRLASILTSGPRCGVYALVHALPDTTLTGGLTMGDLRRASLTLTHDGSAWRWLCPVLGDLPTKMAVARDSAEIGAALQALGEKSIRSMRVAVPFSTIAPAEEQVWTRSSADGLSVPLGRAGATKLQQLELGVGTAQHVLIAGRTGSGKSTLLNIIVTAAAWWYAPSELEMYLVDFKKGVEFKPYARRALPHARVIAVESEREFGLSVLKRLDAELTARGERLRAAGVQGLGAFRALNPGESMPRVLLIVDEFQEFFVEDDKLAQEAGLLLDRLVRQGRAFGVHVILGSQTLAGAYSLARSTMGQMGVRIALQCSEADSYLILADDNPAARLLSRPGEAIYNDASGMLAGNSPFQVAWLDELTRDDALTRLRAVADARGTVTPPAVVFEGSQPADVRGDPVMRAALAGTPSRDVPLVPGSPLAVDGASVATLARRAGASLLVVGQDEDAAASVLVFSAIAAARSAGATVAVVNGLNPGSAGDDALRQLAGMPGVSIHEPAAAGAVVTALRDVVTARAQRGSSQPHVLILAGLARLTALVSREDSFDFSDGGMAPPRVQLDAVLEEILREGPALGVHVLAWADTLAAAERTLRRKALAAIDLRLCMQMSVSDSSTLIDSAAASRLGPNRALLVSMAGQSHSKLRPYRLPDRAWWAEISVQPTR